MHDVWPQSRAQRQQSVQRASYNDPGTKADVGQGQSKISILPLLEAFNSLRRYRNFAVIWVCFWLGVAAYYIFTTPPEFTATTSVVLNPSRQPTSANSSFSESSSLTLDSSQTESQIQVLKSERNLSAVFDALNIEQTVDFVAGKPSLSSQITGYIFSRPQMAENEELRKRRVFQNFVNPVNVKRVGQSYVLELSYVSKDPQLSARVANSISMQYIRSQIELKSASIQRGSEFLQGRISIIQTQLKAAKEGVTTGRVPDIQFPDADAQIISSAVPPLGKSSPKTGLTIALSLTFALFSGLVMLLVMNMIDKTVRSSAQIAAYLAIACYAEIVRDRRLSRKAAVRPIPLRETDMRPHLRFQDGIRKLYTELSLSAAAEQQKIIGVFSWSFGEGKTTIARALAEELAASGRSVLLIDLDLRKPDLSSPEIGALGQVWPRASHRGTSLAELSAVDISQTLKLLSADNFSVDRLSEIGPAIERYITGSGGAGRIVIIDTPALSADPDILSVCSIVNSALLVMEADRSALDDGARALLALRNVAIFNIGAALNKCR